MPPEPWTSLSFFDRLWQFILFFFKFVSLPPHFCHSLTRSRLFAPKRVPTTSYKVEQLTPWHINYLGGEWRQATKCYGGGDNSWEAGHLSYNGGLSNHWVSTNTPYSWGYFKREDVPVHWDIAEGWTVCFFPSVSVHPLTWILPTLHTSYPFPSYYISYTQKLTF